MEKIRSRIGELKGKKITLVLSDNTAVFGELRDVGDDDVVLMNGRLRNNRIPFKTIKELYFDQIV
jgi:hypothetical protein